MKPEAVGFVFVAVGVVIAALAAFETPADVGGVVFGGAGVVLGVALYAGIKRWRRRRERADAELRARSGSGRPV